MTAYRIAQECMRYKSDHGFWFAQWIQAAREGREFTVPEPKLEDYTRDTYDAYDAAAHAAAYPGF